MIQMKNKYQRKDISPNKENKLLEIKVSIIYK